MVKTLRFAPARSLMYFVSIYPSFCLTPSLNLLRQPEPYRPRHRARTPYLTKQPTYVSINTSIKEDADGTSKQTNQWSTKQFVSLRFDLDHCSKKQYGRRNNVFPLLA